jgi:hypothetical protein
MMASQSGAPSVDRRARNEDEAPRTDDERRQPERRSPPRWLRLDTLSLAAVVVATLITYGVFLANPWPASTMRQFLAMLARDNAAAWPMQLFWYACAVTIVGLALWSPRRATPIICLVAAVYVAWIGVTFFGVLNPGMNFAWLWASVFALEGALFVVAGVLRYDLIIAPRWDRWDVASVLGAMCLAYALIAYPIIGMLTGHALSTLPVFGLAPCPTAIFALGLLLWARKPAPLYLLPFLLAWCLGAAPPDLSRGVVADIGMLVAGVSAALVILWRDRTTPWKFVAACAALILMIAWSGHEDVLMGIALVLVALTLVDALRRRSDASPRLAPGERGRPEPADLTPRP